ncbi:hypothetical protein HNQ08_002244 [Deinococcus humi]|uniref:Uncharacterized protein n=1 Tax=Deinococcus humi TaxID=662880 RepID=A0A7W8JWQ3_9DEIO|nr:hypothetical protein [Deinococcus humi]
MNRGQHNNLTAKWVSAENAPLVLPLGTRSRTQTLDSPA